MLFTRAVVGEGAQSSVLRTAPPRAQSGFRSRSRLVRSRVATRRAMRPVGWVKPLRCHPAQGEQTLNMWARSPWCMIYMADALACPWFRSVGDPAPELVGVPRVGSLCGFFARVCGSSVAVSRLTDLALCPLNFTHLRFGGATARAWEAQRLRIQCTAHAPFPWSLPRQGLHTTGHLRRAAARRPPESSVRLIPSVSGGSTTWRPC